MLVDIPFILMGAFVFLFAPWRWSTFGGKLKLGVGPKIDFAFVSFIVWG